MAGIIDSINNSVSGAMSNTYGNTLSTPPKQTLASSLPQYNPVGSIKDTTTIPADVAAPKPTPVVSSKPAIAQASNIQNTVTNQNNANANAKTTLYLKSTGQSQEVSSSDLNSFLSSGNWSTTAPAISSTTNSTDTTTKSTPTLEDNLSNAPDTGMQIAYNLSTGQRQDQPIGTLPSGYSSQDPTTRKDVTSTATDSNGVQYKQFNDGTYGRFDEQGNYSPAAASFQAAQDAQGFSDKIKAIQNGTFQLLPNQQAQLDGLSAKYNALIQAKMVENANTTGATTLAENMYGMGNNLIGQGVITKTVNDGLEKIAELQLELASGLATMTDAFQKDDMSLLKDSYTAYETNQKDIQAEIDKQAAYIQSEADKRQTANENDAIAQGIKFPNAGILPSDSPQVVQQKLSQDPQWKAEAAIKAATVDPDAIDAMVAQYTKTGVVPIISGMNAQPIRNAFWAAVGGKPGKVDQAEAGKAGLAAATKALSNQTELQKATQSANIALKGAMQVGQTTLAPLFKTNSPFLNKPIQWIQEQLQGNPDLSSQKLALTSIASEYAKIISGPAASISGVSVTSQTEILNQLYSALSNGQIENVFKTMQQDANQRELSYQVSIDSTKSDINALSSTVTTPPQNTTTTGSTPPNGRAF